MANCFSCKKKFGTLEMKWRISNLVAGRQKIPDGMNKEDALCTNCCKNIPQISTEEFLEKSKDTLSAKEVSKIDLSNRAFKFKEQWDKTGIIQFKNERVAILKRMVGQQVQFIVAYDDLTKEGYELKAIDEGQGMGDGITAGLSAYFYFQKLR